MRISLLLIALILLPAAAHASTLTFVLNGEGDNYVFTLDSDATQDPSFSFPTVGSYDVTVTDTLVSPFTPTPEVFGLDTIGDVGFSSSGLILAGDPLHHIYSGPIGSPTFLAGTYAFVNGTDNNAPYVLTITSPVPEPSSFALLSTGVVGIAGAFRRRIFS